MRTGAERVHSVLPKAAFAITVDAADGAIVGRAACAAGCTALMDEGQTWTVVKAAHQCHRRGDTPAG
ncbi:MAG: hypothetical protein H6990_04175 [Pseudomonadales bacterium]|nr:hypothetical protein [Pseudomonadales bacterium]